MDSLQALILGIVQGLTEYLPVSSSGHLEIFREILGIDLPSDNILTFDVVLHAATVLSTLVILWREFAPLCSSFFSFKRDDNFYYVCKLLVSCIPVAIVGFCFKDFVESFFGGSLTVVGICLLVTASLLAFSYFFRTKPLRPNLAFQPRDISWIDAFVIGIAQAIAVLPGLSRSGSTIATGIILGNKSEKVATFSFFMVIIPILGEMLLDIKKILAPATEVSGQMSIGIIPIIIGFISAFIVGCVACKWMLSIVKRGKLIWFAIYCLLAGLLCIIY